MLTEIQMSEDSNTKVICDNCYWFSKLEWKGVGESSYDDLFDVQDNYSSFVEIWICSFFNVKIDPLNMEKCAKWRGISKHYEGK